MNLHEFFRSFMGFPSRRDPRLGEPPYRDDDVFGGDDNPYEGSIFGDPWDMFRHLDSVFRSFGLSEFPPFSHGADVPAIEGPDRNEPGHLRDHMLKVPDYSEPFQRSPEMFPHFPPGRLHPEESPYFQMPPFCPGPPQPEETPCRDMDLDEHVARSGLGSLFTPVPFEAPPQPAPGPPPGWWGGSSSSVHTFSSHNGKIQERTVLRDAQGNEEVTVRRSLGDRSVTVRTVTRPDGVTETQEQYINMDEGDKASFEQMWQGSSAGSSSGHMATDRDMFRRLFGFLPPSKSQ